MRWTLIVLCLVGVANTSDAGGRLGKVVSGLRDKAGDDKHQPQPAYHESDDEGDNQADYDADYDGSVHQADEAIDIRDGYRDDDTSFGFDVDLDLYLGVQNVIDSDGSLSAGIRAGYSRFGLFAAATGYFEGDSRSDEMTTLTAWSLGADYLLAQPFRRTGVWISGGASGLSSTGVSVTGAFVGVRALHRLTRSVAFDAAGSHHRYQEGIRGNHYSVGVSVSVLRLSYRVSDLSVGPLLHGPEFGLAVAF